MNWIATAFEALKARVEAHIPTTNKALNDLNSRLSGVQTYTQKSVESLEARQQDLDSRTGAAFATEKANYDALAARVAALESSKVTGSCAQPDRAPL
jgi:hypothetical protein